MAGTVGAGCSAGETGVLAALAEGVEVGATVVVDVAVAVEDTAGEGVEAAVSDALREAVSRSTPANVGVASWVIDSAGVGDSLAPFVASAAGRIVAAAGVGVASLAPQATKPTTKTSPITATLTLVLAPED